MCGTEVGSGVPDHVYAQLVKVHEAMTSVRDERRKARQPKAAESFRPEPSLKRKGESLNPNGTLGFQNRKNSA